MLYLVEKSGVRLPCSASPAASPSRHPDYTCLFFSGISGSLAALRVLHCVTQAVTVLAVRFVILTAGYSVRLCRFTSLRSFLTHFVQPQHVHRLPSFCSPAGRIGLRLGLVCIAAATLWRSIRQALCSALRAVIVFAERKQKPTPALHFYRAASRLVRLSLAAPLLHSQCGSQAFVRSSLRLACPSAITLRSTASVQPFSSRLFFLAFGGRLTPFGCLLIFYIALSAPLPSQHKKSSVLLFFT